MLLFKLYIKARYKRKKIKHKRTEFRVIKMNKNLLLTIFFLLGCLCLVILTPIVIKMIFGRPRKLVCGRKEDYISDTIYHKTEDFEFPAQNNDNLNLRFSRNLISMDHDLLMTRDKAVLIIFMLNLPKYISTHLK